MLDFSRESIEEFSEVMEIKINVFVQGVNHLIGFLLGDTLINESFKVLKSFFCISDSCLELSDLNNYWWIFERNEVFVCICFKSILLEFNEFLLFLVKPIDSSVDFIDKNFKTFLHFS
jgi:hypothetical protein